MAEKSKQRLRSREWFDISGDPSATALHIERYTNFGITAAELRSGKPIIGIAQTGSDLVPCNRIHIDLARRIREGIREAGGIARLHVKACKAVNQTKDAIAPVPLSCPAGEARRQTPHGGARSQPAVSEPG